MAVYLQYILRHTESLLHFGLGWQHLPKSPWGGLNLLKGVQETQKLKPLRKSINWLNYRHTDLGAQINIQMDRLIDKWMRPNLLSPCYTVSNYRQDIYEFPATGEQRASGQNNSSISCQTKSVSVLQMFSGTQSTRTWQWSFTSQ